MRKPWWCVEVEGEFGTMLFHLPEHGESARYEQEIRLASRFTTREAAENVADVVRKHYTVKRACAVDVSAFAQVNE